jgi:hypothetical protein
VETALQVLAEAGIPGAVIIIMGWAVFTLQRENTRLAEARVEDAKKVSSDALAREDKWVATLGELTDAIKEMNRRS